MADSIPNSSTVRITIESDSDGGGTSEIKNGEVSNPTVDSTTNFPCFDKPRVVRPSSFLRPSALSGGFKPSSTSSATPTLPDLSANKFASPDSTLDLFNVPSSTEKKEPKPSLTTPVTIPAPTPLSNPNYVFGQNLLERVVDRQEAVSNGTSSLLFSAALGAESEKEATPAAEAKEASSLLEDAARCQEQRAKKRRYEEVLVTTGEEDEKNVLQITVKLFAFESGSWVERGRGNLRLNDATDGGSGSRIVVRTMGSWRVSLNTKIWAEMELTRASDKSIRITAMDAAGQLKIFLIQASPADMTTLYNCLESRVRRCKAEDKARVDKPEENSPKKLKDENGRTETNEQELPSSGSGESGRSSKEGVEEISS